MSSIKKLLTIGLFVVVAHPSRANHGDSVGTHDIIQGVLSRSESVFSGRIDYRLRKGFSGKESSTDYQLVFSGSSWKLISKTPISAIQITQSKAAKQKQLDLGQLRGSFKEITVSHRGKAVNFRTTPQLNGSERKNARVSQEVSVTSTFPSPPVFAGSFWFECTKQFIRSNQDKVSRKPAAEVNGILTEVLEWDVQKASAFQAFHSINELTSDGGVLRLHISPQYGHVLPRIEYLSRSRKVAASFDSSDFRESTSGIYIPHRCTLQYYSKQGPGFRAEYEINETKDINQRISDDEFVLQLPADTRVFDSRGDNTIILNSKGQDGVVPPALDDVIELQGRSFFGWNVRTALLGGSLFGVTLLGLCLVFRKRIFRRILS